MKKLIKGKKYYDTVHNDNFEVMEIKSPYVQVKYDNHNPHHYLLEDNGNVEFPLIMLESDYNKGHVTDINPEKTK